MANNAAKADINLDALYKARMDKDLKELQEMIERHFKQRLIDDEELRVLTERIEKRKAARVKQIEERQEREKARMQKEKHLREQKLEEERLKKEEEEERKRSAMAAMTANKYRMLEFS